MYNRFFGFRERPFQLVPNPAYLFLSRSHEEAMAHLVYAIAQGDGFVEITGEVGTGKTTLCRAVLENLDKFTEAAYIFNPKLDAFQLLRTINDEFGLSSDGETIKDLIDTLNAFLMKKKTEGKKVVIMIDEAQNLSKDVLEQLRLLSNLETTTSKLMQIILVGQPELSEMLDSHDLRQLGQRIALSCHLTPLTYKETKAYVEHRIQVASQKPEAKFATGAYRAIYRYSGGIPRLINIACDRALLTAFGLNRKTVTGVIAKASIRELSGRGDSRKPRFLQGVRMPVSFGVLLGVFLAVLYLATIFLIIHRSVDLRINTLLEAKDLERPKVTQKVESVRGVADAAQGFSEAPVHETIGPFDPAYPREHHESPLPPPEAAPDAVLASMNRGSTRVDALSGVLDAWPGKWEISASLNDMDDDQAFFRIGARQNGLQLLRIPADLELFRKLNLPAVVELRLPGTGEPVYLALVRMHEGALVFNIPEQGFVQWDHTQLKPYWSGYAYVLWKDFLGYERVIPFGDSADAVISLKTLLRDLGYEGIEIGPAYDTHTVTVIKGVQAKHGIPADGLVGPFTKIVLYNEDRSLDVPRLVDTP